MKTLIILRGKRQEFCRGISVPHEAAPNAIFNVSKSFTCLCWNQKKETIFQMPDNLSEPLIEKGEVEWLQSKHTPRSRGWAILTFLQAFTLCLIPLAYFLGYKQGAKVLPKLPTHSRFPPLCKTND